MPRTAIDPSRRESLSLGGRRRRRILGALTLAIGAMLALCAAELLLRASGRGPWQSLPVPSNEPVMYEPDPVLGWRSKPGRYDFPGYAPGAKRIRMTYLPDGSRATRRRADRPRDGQELVLLGGSVTQGWGISDEETFSWRLQTRFPSLRIRNFGTGGYGTYQSLLALERRLSRKPPPRAVLYGFIQQHEERNVASYAWLHSLAQVSRSGVVAVPFATLSNGGALERHPPQPYPSWPLREHLATVAFLEDLGVRARTRGRAAQARAVTQRLIASMRDRCESEGVRFAVALLWVDRATKIAYARALGSAGIDFLDCVYTIPLERRVPGDGHPDGAHNALWSHCLAEGLEARGWLPASPAG